MSKFYSHSTFSNSAPPTKATGHFDSTSISQNHAVPLLPDKLPVDAFRFPYVVFIYSLYKNADKLAEYIATGTIIHSNLVLTSREAVARSLGRHNLNLNLNDSCMVVAGASKISSGSFNRNQGEVQTRRCRIGPPLLSAQQVVSSFFTGRTTRPLFYDADQILIIEEPFQYGQTIKPICLGGTSKSLDHIDNNKFVKELIMREVFSSPKPIQEAALTPTVPVMLGFSNLGYDILVPCVIAYKAQSNIKASQILMCVIEGIINDTLLSTESCSTIDDFHSLGEPKQIKPNIFAHFGVMLPYTFEISYLKLWNRGGKNWTLEEFEVWVPKEANLNPFYQWDNDVPIDEYARWVNNNHVIVESSPLFDFWKLKSLRLKRVHEEIIARGRLTLWTNFASPISTNLASRNEPLCKSGMYCFKGKNPASKSTKSRLPIELGLPWLASKNNSWYQIGMTSSADVITENEIQYTSRLALDDEDVILTLLQIQPSYPDELNMFYAILTAVAVDHLPYRTGTSLFDSAKQVGLIERLKKTAKVSEEELRNTFNFFPEGFSAGLYYSRSFMRCMSHFSFFAKGLNTVSYGSTLDYVKGFIWDAATDESVAAVTKVLYNDLFPAYEKVYRTLVNSFKSESDRRTMFIQLTLKSMDDNLGPLDMVMMHRFVVRAGGLGYSNLYGRLPFQ